MTQPKSTYIPAAGFEIHVTEWGDKSKPALVMWHGPNFARSGSSTGAAAPFHPALTFPDPARNTGDSARSCARYP